jgi:glycosyltransferase involved in cell wall biosynthesis
MKILTLNYEFPPLGGGGSAVSFEIAKGLAKLNHQIDVVTMGYRDLPSVEKIEGIKIYRVKCFRKKKEICKTHEMLSYVVAATFFLPKLIKKEHYDICHCHFLIPTGLLALLMKKICGLNYVITAHGSDIPGHNKDRFTIEHRFTKPLISLICKNAKVITTPSNQLKKELVESIGLNFQEKILVLPNGSRDFYEKGIKKENIIYSSGRLVELKGFQYLIKAFNNLSQNDWSLYIVGDGPYKEELQKMAAQNPRIVFIGWLDNHGEKYAEIVNKAKIFCLLSVSESQGISMIEAMGVGCAVLVSNIPTFKETVKSSFGILVDRENVEAVTGKLSELIKNPALLLRLMAGAKTEYESIYEPNKIVKKYENILSLEENYHVK